MWTGTILNHTTSVAVVGAGAFGRNHARVYHELAQQDPSVKLAAIVDSDPARAEALARAYHARACTSIDQLIRSEKVTAASVTVPTIEHLAVASRLMEAGVDVLIEKPLAASLDEADKLVALAQRTGSIGQVGHLERFNPAVRATLPLITQPMFFEVHRLSVFTPRSLDVDVVLDLMIHDLDVVLAFVNSPVKEIRAVGLPVLSPKVDIANVRMEFDSGCVANLTASRVSTERVRKLRLFQPREYISLDYTRKDAVRFRVGPDMAIQFAPLTAIKDEPLRLELEQFFESMTTRHPRGVTGEQGLTALETAFAILDKIELHSRRVAKAVEGGI
jgi:predicted dehydrogenase